MAAIPSGLALLRVFGLADPATQYPPPSAIGQIDPATVVPPPSVEVSDCAEQQLRVDAQNLTKDRNDQGTTAQTERITKLITACKIKLGQ
jgi:hypothetical protein